jgi:hypothetical protein
VEDADISMYPSEEAKEYVLGNDVAMNAESAGGS